MAARKKTKNLVIVESPAKAKTIQKYLGPDYEVTASKGHVRDLPKSRFGIDIENNWSPTYRPLQDRKSVLDSLKKMVKTAKIVYLAPDPDREGEAIAWHLKEALGLSDDQVKRVTFNEITKKAVQAAFEHPREIDMDRVQAQEARRFLDRVVGYNLSPLLSRKLARQLSAGRVQSVAVRLIVDREREISAFKPEEYWKVVALLASEATVDRALIGPETVRITEILSDKPKRGKKKVTKGENSEEDDGGADTIPDGSFIAEMVGWKGAKFAADNRALVNEVVEGLSGKNWVIKSLEEKEKANRPSPPFTTSTLQQQASLRMGYSASRTMRTAQRLYEGVEMGKEGQVALITYMRTDSTKVSSDALQAVRAKILADFGPTYLPDKPNAYESGKSAQEAHEAIRPTELRYTPEMVARVLPSEQARLYTLIYNRFLASQMKPAISSVTTVEITAGEGLFRTSGSILRFDGFRRVMPLGKKDDEPQLPALKQGQGLDLLRLDGSQHFTQPPPRFNEASLVKTLEKEGIGRPSTYASIISKIQERNYVEQQDRRFHATSIGMEVVDMLVENFSRVMDLKFTSHMEAELDRIETEHIPRNAVLDEFYGPFRENLNEASEKLGASEKCPKCGKGIQERFSRRGRFFGCAGYPECDYIKRPEGEPERKPAEVTEHICPTCGKNMVKRFGKGGPFLGCAAYPECKTTMNLTEEGGTVLASKPTEHQCEKCSSPMILRTGKRGPFLACSAYPKCRQAVDVDADGNPKKPVELGIACEKCGAQMAIKRGPRGPFLGCSAYPKCRGTKQITPQIREELGDKLPPVPVRAAVPEVAIDQKCPKCEAPMKLRSGAKGFFLGCTKYPKCRGVMEPPEELKEQIKAAEAAGGTEA